MSYPPNPGQPPAPGGPPYGGYPPQYEAPPPTAWPPRYNTPYPPGAWQQQTGWPPQYGQPPGFGYRPPASTAPAYVVAALFAACAVLSFVLAIVSWSGKADPHVVAAVIGVIESHRVTGNIDFGISATMTTACTTLTFALVLLARLSLARWVLVVVGGIVTLYYLTAIIYLLAHDGAALTGLPAAALALWLCATVVAALPATARAMRGRRRPQDMRQWSAYQ